MYVDQHGDNTVTVEYIPAHTGHKPGPEEHKFLPLPKTIQEQVSVQLLQGIPAKRILKGKAHFLAVARNHNTKSSFEKLHYLWLLQ